MKIAGLQFDAADAPLIVAHQWHVTSNGYVARTDRRCRPRVIYMHRLLMGNPHGCHVDHINGDKLDNRRANLRLATYAQNQANRPPNKNNKTGVRGVVWRPADRRWIAVIGTNRRQVHLGYFQDIEEATRVRRAAELLYFGELCPV